MTDPISGEMASQAAEQIADQPDAAEEVGETEPASDFSELMSSPDGGESPGEVDETEELDPAEKVEPIEEVSETELDDFVQRMLHEESSIHEMMENCLDGGAMDQKEMLQMQAVIYGYSQRVDLTTKVVENATSGIEQVMNTQV